MMCPVCSNSDEFQFLGMLALGTFWWRCRACGLDFKGDDPATLRR